MAFRPGAIRGPFVGVDSAVAGTNSVIWEHTFYPETLRTDSTLQDQIFANLIRCNQAYSAANGTYYVCQGIFHPDYAGATVSLGVSFSVITPNATTVDLEGSLRGWNASAAINQAHSYTQYNKSVIVSAADRVYNSNFNIAAVGNLVANNLWQCRILLHDKNDSESVSIIAVRVTYAIAKFYI